MTILESLPHTISRSQMAAALNAAFIAGEIDPDNGYSRAPYGEWWAAACKGITVVSILPAHEDGWPLQMRWDAPGSMHPHHRAAVMFAPERLDHAYLRDKADRLIVVTE